jgi:hypothetical protein
MAHGESMLRPGEWLESGQYLLSKNGVFTAFMGPDGNFVVFRGDGLASHLWDSWWTQEYRSWASQNHGAGPHRESSIAYMTSSGIFKVFQGVNYSDLGGNGDYDLVMSDRISFQATAIPQIGDFGCLGVFLEDDGVLRIQSKFPERWGKVGNYNGDPLVDEEHIPWTKIEYDTENAVTTPNGPPKSASQITAVNNSSTAQDTTLDITYTTATTTGWKHSAGVKIGAKDGGIRRHANYCRLQGGAFYGTLV